MRESKYQADLIGRIKQRLPGCFVMKQDSSYVQGIPDLVIFFESQWAMLEVKKSKDEKYEPNQEYYLESLGEMSFTSTIYPENEAEVLDALQSAFGVGRPSRLPQSKHKRVG